MIKYNILMSWKPLSTIPLRRDIEKTFTTGIIQLYWFVLSIFLIFFKGPLVVKVDNDKNLNGIIMGKIEIYVLLASSTQWY